MIKHSNSNDTFNYMVTMQCSIDKLSWEINNDEKQIEFSSRLKILHL